MFTRGQFYGTFQKAVFLMSSNVNFFSFFLGIIDIRQLWSLETSNLAPASIQKFTNLSHRSSILFKPRYPFFASGLIFKDIVRRKRLLVNYRLLSILSA